MLRVLLFGGRDFKDSDIAESILNQSLEISSVFREAYENNTLEFIHGDARGADKTLGEIAEDTIGIECTKFPAQWTDLVETPDNPVRIGVNRFGIKYNKLAGMNRNTKMVNHCHMAIGIWDGISDGTKDSITKLNRKDKTCLLFDYTGERILGRTVDV